MLLGKRQRPLMRRTTSMAGILENPQETQRSSGLPPPPPPPSAAVSNTGSGWRPQQQQYLQGQLGGWNARVMSSSTVPQRKPRRNSGDFAVVETAHFLRACGLCKRSLGPGRDTYMYRGEIAFCSLECRQQQVALDERKDKCSLTSIKNEPPHVPAGSESSGSSGKTVVAA